ncbi:LLM class flavin-dependent oxidoreductase [Natrinema salifodinae]|uniref:Coenzyme F420-dependent glucose-6-phosphate dehydrogenase n=1 Tax=Natrinema salifodinae TaxID=1202768 RepID=A0A1I0Q8N8_9EURY|nr:LLM class flavin-dependent oxidoreductase [Natrinema salifodinae]SEW23184.1 coenzyme F420-dependent glucose-6-phosphate dehydrogenase [Natrinema salifodinae]
MVRFGWFASLEEFSPAECLRQVELAEEAGFDTAWVNDHFHPWFDHLADGSPANGGNCWEWLPAALERTDDLVIGTGVSAIIHRYHPANVAHRLATLAELYPDRIFLGLGSGEALNESPLGLPMPEFGECARRTAEAIRIIRALFEEEFVDYDGQFWSLNGANLYTGPDEAPPVYIASNGPTFARMAGDLGDGYVTVYESPERVREDLFPSVERGIEKSDRNDSFTDLDRSIHLHVSYDPDSETAALEPCLPWRGTMLDIFFEADIADPRTIKRHGDMVDPDYLAEQMTITTDPQDLIDVTAEYVDAGFDHIVYQSHSPDQEAFCEMVQEEVFPSFADATGAP